MERAGEGVDADAGLKRKMMDELKCRHGVSFWAVTTLLHLIFFSIIIGYVIRNSNAHAQLCSFCKFLVAKP